MFERDLWVEDHLESTVVRVLSFVDLVKSVHTFANPTNALKHVHAHLFVDEFKSAEVVHLSVIFFVSCQLLCAEVASVLKAKALHVDLFK